MLTEGSPLPNTITKYQHVIPQLHLRYFANNGKVNVLDVWDGREYPQNIADIGGSDFIYDFNTANLTSMENLLKIDEQKFGGPMARLIEGKEDLPSDYLVEYLCMLSSRSYSIIEAAFDYSLHETTQICGVKNIPIYSEQFNIILVERYRYRIRGYYINRSHLLNGKDRGLFEARIITMDGACELITADIPYYLRNVYGNMYETPDYLYKNPNNWIWLCPISTKKCMVVARKGQFEANNVIKAILTSDSKLISDRINEELMYYSYRCVYSKNSSAVIYKQYKTMVPNPMEQESRRNITSIMKLSKHYNIKKER